MTGLLAAANGDPYGISSDGTNIYVVDLADRPRFTFTRLPVRP